MEMIKENGLGNEFMFMIYLALITLIYIYIFVRRNRDLYMSSCQTVQDDQLPIRLPRLLSKVD